jgi:hypothetical protein
VHAIVLGASLQVHVLQILADTFSLFHHIAQHLEVVFFLKKIPNESVLEAKQNNFEDILALWENLSQATPQSKRG